MPPRWQPSLEDYIDIAAFLLAVDREAIVRLPQPALAESALHTPLASFGRSRPTQRCPSRRPSCSHTSPTTLRSPTPTSAPRSCSRHASSTPTALTWRAPDVDIDAGIVERIAAGEAAHDEIVDWIRERTRKEGDEPRAAS